VLRLPGYCFQVCAFAFFSFRLCTFTLLSAVKQTEVAFDAILPLGWANRFFIHKVISVCHRWAALRLRFAFNPQHQLDQLDGRIHYKPPRIMSLSWRGIPGILSVHSVGIGGQFWASVLHRKVTSKDRLLPTPSGTSNSHAVPVQLRAAARVLIARGCCSARFPGIPASSLWVTSPKGEAV